MVLIYYSPPDLLNCKERKSKLELERAKEDYDYDSLSTFCLPAVSHNPKLTVLPSTTTFALKLSKTVGT